MNVLEIRSKEEVYAIDSNLIYKIIKKIDITPLPLVDRIIKGVCAIDGKIVIAIDFNLLFNKEDEINSIIVVKIEETLYALLVSQVLDIKEVEYEEETDENVIGFYKTNTDIVQILNLKSLIEKISFIKYSPIEVDETKEEENKSKNTVRRPFLLFKLDNEFFAIEVNLIREVIFANLKITPLAGSEAKVISVRNKSIKLLEFTKLFNLKSNKNLKNRIIILQKNNKTLSFLVDEVIDIVEFDIEEIEKNDDEKISGIYKLKDDIVSIIDNFYLENLINKFFTEEEIVKEKKEENMKEFLSFKIQDEEYAIDIDYVEEVVRVTEITPLPNTKDYIKGVINLRGEVIVVISLPKRLGFKENITPKSKIIVVKKGNLKAGLLVDEVNDVLSIKEEDINISNTDSLIKEIANIDNGKRIILILNLDALINEEEVTFKEEK